jgi:hypothetical protein
LNKKQHACLDHLNQLKKDLNKYLSSPCFN